MIYRYFENNWDYEGCGHAASRVSEDQRNTRCHITWHLDFCAMDRLFCTDLDMDTRRVGAEGMRNVALAYWKTLDLTAVKAFWGACHFHISVALCSEANLDALESYQKRRNIMFRASHLAIAARLPSAKPKTMKDQTLGDHQ